jgi:hypothetical protein
MVRLRITKRTDRITLDYELQAKMDSEDLLKLWGNWLKLDVMKYKLFPLLLLALTTSSCAGTTAAGHVPVVCSEPRPQICTHDYNPVCATRNTGLNSVTTQQPTTENKTYSNGCSACSDKNVISYRPGSC